MDTNIKIVRCRECGAENRVKPHSESVRPVCGRCGTALAPRSRLSSLLLTLLNLALLSTWVAAVFGIVYTPSLLSKDFSDLEAVEDKKTSSFRESEEKRLVDLESTLKAELAQIDVEQLRNEADRHYRSILDARRSYDKRYALTPREKVQLKMQGLANDSAISYREAIKTVALEASPKGSDIEVLESTEGVSLRIDFDMSSMTSGEHGTRTKHTTKGTLKKEVISLISRVTNDLFQFCKQLDLQTVHVGCRHYVTTEFPDGSTRDENEVLYKISIKAKQIHEFVSNPFLDIYSTTQHFDVEEDNFENIEIITVRE